MTPTLTPPHTSLNYSFLGWWFHIWTFLRFNSIFSRVFWVLTHPSLCLISPSSLPADCISCQWSCYSLLQVIVKNINWCMAKSQYLYQPLGNIPAVSHKRCHTKGVTQQGTFTFWNLAQEAGLSIQYTLHSFSEAPFRNVEQLWLQGILWQCCET